VRFDRAGSKTGRFGHRITLVLPAGKNKLYITGRDGKKRFPPGLYRVSITRVDGNGAAWRSSPFRVLAG
jgi:hypothetical protein